MEVLDYKIQLAKLRVTHELQPLIEAHKLTEKTLSQESSKHNLVLKELQ